MIKIAIIAGEPSGDILAANLMLEIKSQCVEEVKFIGIGGYQMNLAGLNSSFDMSVLSVGGYGLDVIMSIPKIYNMYRKITQEIIVFKPDVFIGVDAPGFNLHVEKKLKAHNIKTVHYVSPTIWAWRYERIYKIKKITDLMLCIFPIEEALYKKEQIRAIFVGHSLADQIELDIDTKKYKDTLFNKISKIYRTPNLISTNHYVISVLVGSRISEIKSLSKIFIKACEIINQQIPSIKFLFPFVNANTKNIFEDILSKTPHSFDAYCLLNQTSDAIKSSNLVLAKSGTVTLEVALCKKPMVISYKVSKFTAWILKNKLTTKYVGQPNIMLNEEVVPELLQDMATPSNIANAVLSLYKDPARQDYIIKKFYELHRLLKKEASKKSAQAILEFINESRTIY